MSAAGAQPAWPGYVLFVLGMAALLFSVFSFMQSHQLRTSAAVVQSSALSGQLLAERMLNLAADRARHRELTQLVDEFDALQNEPSPEITAAWAEFRQLLPKPDAVDSVVTGKMPDFAPLIELSDALVVWLEKTDAAPDQTESASHLQQLAGSVEIRLRAATNGSFQPLRARGPWLVFEQILNRFEIMQGNGTIADEDTSRLIGKIRSEFNQLNRVFKATLADLNTLAGSQDLSRIADAHASLSSALSAHINRYTQVLQQPDRWYQLGLLAALISLALLSLLALALWRDARRRNHQATLVRQRDQASILRLLDEISALADGDLDVQATVSEDLTGAIADSVNYAVTELRRLVGAITNSADRVTVAVEETGASASQLARASIVQSREIQRSSAYLEAMSATMTQMSERSREASLIAGRSVENAVNGRQAVEKNLAGLNRIGDQIQQTGGLLRRLGASSQQIGDIVALINKAAARTRLLALNSAIQSNTQRKQDSRYSRIADEVQSLADSLKHSAHDISVLVQIIQDDTRSAMVSMDHTATEVSQGTTLAEQAGDAHRDIETISRRLSVVVDHLAQKSTRQSEVVTQLSSNMAVINDVTRQSAHGMQLSASALDDLRLMASELRDSVADFVMPRKSPRADQADDIVGRPLLKKRDYTAAVARDHSHPMTSSPAARISAKAAPGPQLQARETAVGDSG